MLTGYQIVQTKHGIGYVKEWDGSKAFVVLLKPVVLHGKETKRVLCNRENLKIVGFYDFGKDEII